MEEIGVTQNGNGSVNFIIQTTYPILTDLIASGNLVIGAHYQFAYNTIYLQEVIPIIQTGETEQLVVFATSANTISPVAESLSYPDDRIIYNIADDLAEDGTTARPGFIWRRTDITGNSAPFDFRTILFYRFAVNTAAIPNFITTHAYTVATLIKNGNNVYMCHTAYTSTTSFANDLNHGYWKFLFTYDNTVYLSPSITWAFQEGVSIPINAASYVQNTIFNIGNYVTCQNVVIEDPIVDEIGDPARFACNIVFSTGGAPSFKNITISGSHYNHTFFSTNNNELQYNISLKGRGNGCLFTQCSELDFNSSANISLVSYIDSKNCTFKNTHNDSTISNSTNATIGTMSTSFIYFCIDIVCETISGSFLFYINKGEQKYLTAVNYLPNSTLGSGIYLYGLSNKSFTGNNTYLLVRSSNAATKVYASAFTNISATKTSPDGNIWYDIIDNTGDTTSIALT
jgi:hypothetical protein